MIEKKIRKKINKTELRNMAVEICQKCEFLCSNFEENCGIIIELIQNAVKYGIDCSISYDDNKFVIQNKTVIPDIISMEDIILKNYDSYEYGLFSAFSDLLKSGMHIEIITCGYALILNNKSFLEGSYDEIKRRIKKAKEKTVSNEFKITIRRMNNG